MPGAVAFRACRSLRSLRWIPEFRQRPAHLLAVRSYAGAFTREKLQKSLGELPSHQQEIVNELLGSYNDSQLAQLLDPETAPADVDSPPLPTSDIALNLIQTLLSFNHAPGGAGESGAYDKQLWTAFGLLVKARPTEPPYELLTELLAVAKATAEPGKRAKCIVQVCDLLYSYKAVRLDPYNEVEYLDSLALVGRMSRALSLWSSRRDIIDKQDALYWLEVGILFHQEANLLVSARSLCAEFEALYNFVPPRVMTMFVTKLASLDASQAEEWYSRFASVVDSHGVEFETDVSYDFDQTEAREFYNRERLPSTSLYEPMVCAVLKASQYQLAAKILTDARKHFDDETYPQIFPVSLLIDAAFPKRKTAGKPGPKPKGMNSQARDKAAQEFEDLASTLIENWPSLVHDPSFYSCWLRVLCDLRDFDRVVKVVKAMADFDVPLSSDHVYHVTNAYLLKKDYTGAREFLNSSKLSISQKSASYTLLLQFAARTQPNDVPVIQHEMSSLGIPLNKSGMSVLLYFHYRHNQFDELFKLYFEKGSHFSIFNLKIVWMAMRKCCRDNVELKDSAKPDIRLLFAHTMQQKEMSPETYEIAAQTALTSKDFELLYAILITMDRVLGIPFHAAFALSITELARKFKHNSGTRLVVSFASTINDKDGPVIPSALLCRKLALILDSADDFDSALKLVDELKGATL